MNDAVDDYIWDRELDWFMCVVDRDWDIPRCVLEESGASSDFLRAAILLDVLG